MIAFLLALLLWMLGHGPAPAPHEVTVSPATSTPAHEGSRGALTGARADTSVTPIAPPTPAPTVAEPAPTPLPAPDDGELWDSPAMCNDPIDCPPGQ